MNLVLHSLFIYLRVKFNYLSISVELDEIMSQTPPPPPLSSRQLLPTVKLKSYYSRQGIVYRVYSDYTWQYEHVHVKVRIVANENYD